MHKHTESRQAHKGCVPFWVCVLSTHTPPYTLPAYGMRQLYAWVAELAACSFAAFGIWKRCVYLSCLVCLCACVVHIPGCTYMSSQSHKPPHRVSAVRVKSITKSPVTVCGCAFMCVKWKGWILTAILKVLSVMNHLACSSHRTIKEWGCLLCIPIQSTCTSGLIMCSTWATK